MFGPLGKLELSGPDGGGARDVPGSVSGASGGTDSAGETLGASGAAGTCAGIVMFVGAVSASEAASGLVGAATSVVVPEGACLEGLVCADCAGVSVTGWV